MQTYYQADKVLRKKKRLLAWIAKEDQENIKKILIHDIMKLKDPEYAKDVIDEAAMNFVDILDSLEYGEAYLLLRKNPDLAQLVHESGVDPRAFIPKPDMSFMYKMGVPYKPERYLGPNPSTSERSSLSRDIRELEAEGLIYTLRGKIRVLRIGICPFFYLAFCGEINALTTR